MQGAFFARSTAISFLCNSWQAETFSASHLKQHAKALKTMLVYRICKRSLFFISKTSRRASHHIRCPHVCIAVPKVSCSTATSSAACFRTASSSPGDFVDLMHFRRSRALGLLDLSVTSRFGESKKYWSLSASGVTRCAVFLPSRTYDHLASCLIISPMTIPSYSIYLYIYIYIHIPARWSQRSTYFLHELHQFGNAGLGSPSGWIELLSWSKLHFCTLWHWDLLWSRVRPANNETGEHCIAGKCSKSVRHSLGASMFLLGYAVRRHHNSWCRARTCLQMQRLCCQHTGKEKCVPTHMGPTWGCEVHGHVHV